MKDADQPRKDNITDWRSCLQNVLLNAFAETPSQIKHSFLSFNNSHKLSINNIQIFTAQIPSKYITVSQVHPYK